MPHRVTGQDQRNATTSNHGVFTPAVIAAVVTVACARVVAAFLRRASELRRAGRAPVRQLAYVPVYAHNGTHAAVYVGSGGALGGVEDASDVDDMGLLARAMEHSIRPKGAPRVQARDVVVPVAGAPTNDFPAELFEDPEDAEEPVRMLATLAAAAAVVAGIPAIVRPLEPWAPILVGVAIALGAVAWWLSRRP